ncbi:alcohol dehydrogenase GroES-like domain-containing protein [Colletotrichum gloeosporioides Cg-14]|uniref:Alcohol dehydrogenase GroES-like domain-containing protein n=1 Tax=Colletotrichum gloeosporioides (strain Cg-14) TaxID=1237896 RepID=T0K368_COLGC|nr:alcohol dehydrogenase GroES-like domain-containing protein [Colletotrichum gloeosporioides Cg-14]
MPYAVKSTAPIDNMMKAAVVKQFGVPWLIEDVPAPTAESLDDHDILVKVAVASFCHTDIMVLNGVFHDKPSGLPGSHEPSGTIVALGREAAKSFAVGDRIIAIGIRGPCGNCMDCNGPEEFQLSCKFNKGYAGISSPGAFAEYTVLDDRFAVKIPDELSFIKAAPLTCAGCTSWRAVKRAAVKPGGWLGIVGSGGGLGHLAIQIAKKQGVNVVGIEARDVALELTTKAGASAVDVRPGKAVMVQQVRSLIGLRGTGRGDDLCDATIVLSDAEPALETGMIITKGHGLVVEVAQPKRVNFPFEEMIFRDIRMMGSNLSSRSELADLVRFVVEQDVAVETTVFHGLQSLRQVYELSESGASAGKVVVVIDSTQV